MGMWMPVAGVLITFLIFRKYFTFLWKRRIGELPPGPIPLPVIGNLLDVSRGLPYDAAEKLVRKYGKIVSLMVGDQVTIFIADLPLIRKAFKDDRFSGRPVTIWNYLGLAPNYSHPGIGMEEGEIHREHRKFAEKALRDYGLGTSAGEVFIHQEVSELMQILRDSHGQPMNNAFPFAATVSNVSSYMIYGTSFSPDDPKFIEYIEGDSQVKKESPAGSLLTMFPLLRFIPPFRGSFLRLKSGTVTKHKRVQELIAAHKERFDPNHPRDYIDAYLVAQKSGLASFTDKQLGYNVVDLFGASYGTSTTILRWTMLYMIVYPDVQAKIHEELDRVVGRSRQVAFADRASLPYIEATIHEMFRMANYVPFLLPHKTTEEVSFEGYLFPKNTTVNGLSWYVHKDPQLWTDPDTFLPERFLQENGTLNQVALRKRACPGEQLARMMVLIFFASIMQSFDIVGEAGKEHCTVPVNGFILTPPPYLMRAIPRS